MKISFIKLKNLRQQISRTSVFWQILVSFFFLVLIAILAGGAVFWFYFNQDFSFSTTQITGEEVVNIKKINKVLEKIKDKDSDSATTTIDWLELTDPSF